MQKVLPCCLLLLGVAIMPGESFAHPGGLNSEGCHNNRKTGDYHCHSKPQSRPPTSDQGYADIYFANCDEVRRAGRAPIYRGQPGYRPGLDRDKDGIACEPYR